MGCKEIQPGNSSGSSFDSFFFIKTTVFGLPVSAFRARTISFHNRSIDRSSQWGRLVAVFSVKYFVDANPTRARELPAVPATMCAVDVNDVLVDFAVECRACLSVDKLLCGPTGTSVGLIHETACKILPMLF